MIEKYQKAHPDKEYTCIGLFEAIKQKYNPKRVIYPGCYIHITPSLIFSDVVYVDLFRNTHKFYESKEVREFIEKSKSYKEKTKIKFYQQDYATALPEDKNSFDIIISLYGGFVGQGVKKYLKKGGILVCNNSHGDASMASFDKDYELIAVFYRRSDEKYSISEKDLDTYLIPKKTVSKEEVQKSMKGIAYTKSPSGYIFRKISD